MSSDFSLHNGTAKYGWHRCPPERRDETRKLHTGLIHCKISTHHFSRDFFFFFLMKVPKTDRKCWHSVCPAASISDVMNNAGITVLKKYEISHEPAVFCSSLVKSEPAQMRPDQWNSQEGKKIKILCINIDSNFITTRWNLQMEMFAHFVLTFPATYVFASFPL